MPDELTAGSSNARDGADDVSGVLAVEVALEGISDIESLHSDRARPMTRPIGTEGMIVSTPPATNLAFSSTSFWCWPCRWKCSWWVLSLHGAAGPGGLTSGLVLNCRFRIRCVDRKKLLALAAPDSPPSPCCTALRCDICCAPSFRACKIRWNEACARVSRQTAVGACCLVDGSAEVVG